MYVKSNSSTTSWGRLKYIYDDPAHDGTEHRVLAVTGDNIRLWGSDSPYPSQSGYYLNQQFKAVRQRAWNKHKRHQAQHMILSFSESEFSTDDPERLSQEADQVNELVQGFMEEFFSDSQWVSAVQCDGEGHKLHAHVLINSIDVNGKCVQTNKFSVSTLRREWNRYLDANYFRVTGHAYFNPFKTNEPGKKVTPKGWQADLKKTLDWAKQTAHSIKEYLNLLKSKEVTVTERNKRGDWSYHLTVNGKEKHVRDFYQRLDRKTKLVKATRGMGAEYTPKELNKYFNFKNKNKKGPGENYEEIRKSNSRLERLAESARQQHEQRFIDQLARQRWDDEQSDEGSDKTRSTKHGSGSDGSAHSERTDNESEF